MGPERRRPQLTVTKGDEPSEGTEPIAAVVEDIVIGGVKVVRKGKAI